MADGDEPGVTPAPPVGDTARAVFLAWERLRLVYNATLVLIVLYIAGHNLGNFEFRVFVLEAAVAANLCFCAGPVAEGYLSLLGANRRVVRWLLFIPGTLLGCLLTVAALFWWMLRKFD
jgi:hypothetical protein